jgi:hypothetical protein
VENIEYKWKIISNGKFSYTNGKVQIPHARYIELFVMAPTANKMHI